MVKKMKKWSAIHVQIRITTKSQPLLEGHLLPVPVKFGLRAFPRSSVVILFTERQTERSHNLRQQGKIRYVKSPATHCSISECTAAILEFVCGFDHKNFITISPTVQESWRYQTHTSVYCTLYQKQHTSLRYCGNYNIRNVTSQCTVMQPFSTSSMFLMTISNGLRVIVTTNKHTNWQRTTSLHKACPRTVTTITDNNNKRSK